MKKENQSFDHASDPLEEFFQKGLKGFDFEFQEADWENLEKKMDGTTEALSGTRGINRYRYLAFLCLGISLFFHGIWISPKWKQTDNPKKSELRENASRLAETKENITQKKTPSLSKQEAASSQSSPSPLGSREKTQTVSEYTEEGLGQAKEEPQIREERHASPQKTKPGNAEGPSSNSLRNEQNAPVETNSQTEGDKKSKHPGLDSFFWQSKDLLKNQPKNTAPQSPKQTIPEVLLPHTFEEVKRQNSDSILQRGEETLASLPVPPDTRLRPLRKGLNRWAIGISYTPDISSTGLNDFVSPGDKFGAFVEYYATPRLSFTAGLSFAQKKYTAAGSEYEVYYGFWDKWTGGKVPNQIHASCDVIDLSINARYYFINRPRSNFYVSGGLSSYILTREVYGYEFSYTKPDIATEWVVDNENRNWLGVANLSMGYEFAFHPKFSVQVEPFIKIPLGEVGFGQVNLFTTGSFLNVKYHLGRRY